MTLILLFCGVPCTFMHYNAPALLQNKLLTFHYSVWAILEAEKRIQEITHAAERIFPLCHTIFQIFGTGLVPIVRNYNDAVAGMVSMVCGFMTNVTALVKWIQ